MESSPYYFDAYFGSWDDLDVRGEIVVSAKQRKSKQKCSISFEKTVLYLRSTPYFSLYFHCFKATEELDVDALMT